MNNIKFSQLVVVLILFYLPIGDKLLAKNIDLSTIPSRNSVELTIYNAEDLTLVKETRQISIKKGHNRLQFSWANTQIDPTSVQLHFLSDPEILQLNNTTFPHHKPQMLYWNIASDKQMLTTVEISYFTSGISWNASYTAILEHSLEKMSLDSYVTISNRSGENYDNAQVRLVIGKINLVETVTALVDQSYQSRDRLQARKKNKMEKARQMMQKPPGMYVMRAAGKPTAAAYDEVLEEKDVAKDSLSEYTIFSIAGTESIPNQWSKRLRSSHAVNIDVETVYRYRLREYGDNLARILVFTNDKKSSLGESALPAGNIQIYTKDPSRNLHYLAGLNLKYTSIGDQVELNTGSHPDVHFKTFNLQNYRNNIWMHYKKADILRRIGDGQIKIDHNSKVVAWDEHRLYQQNLRNFSDKSIKVEIRKAFSGDVIIQSPIQMKKYDFQTIEAEIELKPGENGDFLYKISTKNGKNARQNQLKIEQKSLDYPTY